MVGSVFFGEICGHYLNRSLSKLRFKGNGHYTLDTYCDVDHILVFYDILNMVQYK